MSTAAAQQENPLTEGLERRPVPPTTLVIFGATGDLSRRKLLPALYNLAHEGALPGRFHLIGVSRSELSDEDFRKQALESVREFSRREPDPDVLDKLFEEARYVSGTFDQDELFKKLDAALKEFDEKRKAIKDD